MGAQKYEGWGSREFFYSFKKLYFELYT